MKLLEKRPDWKNKVKVVLRFRGREMSHQQLGRDNLEKFKEAIAEYGSVEKAPVLEGRLMTMVVAPLRDKGKSSNKKAASKDAAAEDAPAGTSGSGQTAQDTEE